jgi:hypothetical protein
MLAVLGAVVATRSGSVDGAAVGSDVATGTAVVGGMLEADGADVGETVGDVVVGGNVTGFAEVGCDTGAADDGSDTGAGVVSGSVAVTGCSAVGGRLVGGEVDGTG